MRTIISAYLSKGRENLIEVFDVDEAKRLYEAYQQKYPYDTRKVDKWLENLYSL